MLSSFHSANICCGKWYLRKGKTPTVFYFLAVASKPPEFDQVPPNRTVVKAQELITLRCRSKPPLVIPTVWDWKKDGKPLRAEDISSRRITTNSGQLLIKSATREDTGNYTCTLANSNGSVTSNKSQLIVKGERRVLLVVFSMITDGSYTA